MVLKGSICGANQGLLARSIQREGLKATSEVVDGRRIKAESSNAVAFDVRETNWRDQEVALKAGQNCLAARLC